MLCQLLRYPRFLHHPGIGICRDVRVFPQEIVFKDKKTGTKRNDFSNTLSLALCLLSFQL